MNRWFLRSLDCVDWFQRKKSCTPFSSLFSTSRVLKVELKEPEHKAIVLPAATINTVTFALPHCVRPSGLKQWRICRTANTALQIGAVFLPGGAVCMLILFSASINRPAKTGPNLFKYPSSLSYFLTSNKHKKIYSQEENKNIDDAWRHGVRSPVLELHFPHREEGLNAADMAATEQ